MPADNAASIVNPPASASDAYPLSSYTYVLAPSNSKKAASLKKFLNDAIGDGEQFGESLLFAELPSQVVTAGKSTIAKIGSGS